MAKRLTDDVTIVDRHDATAKGLDPAGFDDAWDLNWLATQHAWSKIEEAQRKRLTVEIEAQHCETCRALPGGAVCSKHQAALVAAYDVQHNAIEAHRATIERFKAGVTVGHLKAAKEASAADKTQLVSLAKSRARDLTGGH